MWKLVSLLLTFAFAQVALSQDAAPPSITPISPYPGYGWCEVCGTIAGTTACATPNLKCCYLYPDYGVCLPYCPTGGIIGGGGPKNPTE
ncbi:hypothetical protein BDN72DRAFT_895092 [Pluteus cervinus]|uniref:Uncharacterized protein n=1 Tax=Pluteus cervinus TaxID=181527 RepID=A0ACD3B2W9_9AGAR|nr:hypothetical protein BDN72DRAFT_895092 [Pluteus cervinus]